MEQRRKPHTRAQPPQAALIVSPEEWRGHSAISHERSSHEAVLSQLGSKRSYLRETVLQPMPCSINIIQSAVFHFKENRLSVHVLIWSKASLQQSCSVKIVMRLESRSAAVACSINQSEAMDDDTHCALDIWPGQSEAQIECEQDELHLGIVHKGKTPFANFQYVNPDLNCSCVVHQSYQNPSHPKLARLLGA